MQEEFADWLQGQLEERGWSRSEAARRGGFSASMMDSAIKGTSGVGLDFCRGIAKAFGMPVEEVLRRAGILPPSKAAEGETELILIYRSIEPDDRVRLLRIARTFYDGG